MTTSGAKGMGDAQAIIASRQSGTMTHASADSPTGPQTRSAVQVQTVVLVQDGVQVAIPECHKEAALHKRLHNCIIATHRLSLMNPASAVLWSAMEAVLWSAKLI